MKLTQTQLIRQYCRQTAALAGDGVRGNYHKYISANLQTFSRKSLLQGSHWEKTARHCVQSMCYTNSRNLSLSNPDFKYYEGYYLVFGMPIEHAFIVYKNRVFDPTATNVGFLEDVTAWGGVHVPHEFLKKTHNYSPVLFDYFLSLCGQFESGRLQRF